MNHEQRKRLLELHTDLAISAKRDSKAKAWRFEASFHVDSQRFTCAIVAMTDPIPEASRAEIEVALVQRAADTVRRLHTQTAQVLRDLDGDSNALRSLLDMKDQLEQGWLK